MLPLLEVCSFLWTGWWEEMFHKVKGRENTLYVRGCIAMST